MKQHGCRNFLIALVFLSIVGAFWALQVDAPSGSLLAFAKWCVGVISIGVLGFTVMGIVNEFRWIVDWLAIPWPRPIQHSVLGELRYEDRVWSSRIGAVSVNIGGRRQGPEAEMLDAGARVASRLHDYELRARSYALDQFPELADEPLGELLTVSVFRAEMSRAIEVSLWFRLWRCEHDGLEVAFVGDEPVRLRRPICVGIEPGETLPPIPD